MATVGDIVVNLSANTQKFSSALKSTHGAFDALSHKAMHLAGIFGAAFGLHHVVEAAEEQERSINKLGAVLAATGNAAGVSSKQVEELASSLQKTTDFGDETTISAAAILATFKSIKGVQFTETVKAAQDLSTVTGQDLQASMKTLGKALEDPAHGLNALRKAGIVFTEEQREQIKTLAESGQILKAQTKILDAVHQRVGGAAEAASTPLGRFKNLLGDMAENLGYLLLPSLEVFTKEMTSLIDTGIAGASTFKLLGEILGGIATGFGKWSKTIATVIAGMIAIKTVTWLVVAAEKAHALALAVVQGLQGPKGWAVLAVGLAAAAVAATEVEKQFKNIHKAATGASRATADIVGIDSADIGAATAEKIGKFDPWIPDTGAAELIGSLQDIRDQTQLLNGEMTKGEVAARKFWREHFLTTSVIDGSRDAMGRYAAELGKAIDEFEKLDNANKKQQDLFDENMRLAEEIDKLSKEIGDKPDRTQELPTGLLAAQKGSSEAFSAIQAAITATNNADIRIKKETEKNTKKTAELLEKMWQWQQNQELIEIGL